MPYCKNCGNEVDVNAAVCPSCGVAQENKPVSEDTGSFGWGLLGCCIPLVGLILFLVWKDTKPKTAKMAGKGALISLILSVVYYIIVFAFGIGMSFM